MLYFRRPTKESKSDTGDQSEGYPLARKPLMVRRTPKVTSSATPETEVVVGGSLAMAGPHSNPFLLDDDFFNTPLLHSAAENEEFINSLVQR